MFKSFKSILLGLLFNILGRSIFVSIFQYLRKLLHEVPMSRRRSFVKASVLVPLWFARLVLNFTTSPLGDERKWIHKIKQSTWRGVWIAPNLNSLKQAEDAALNNDLTILYIHGGGFCMGHAKMYMETFQLMINHLRNVHHIRASILSLEYSLSPESVWPKACDEAIDAYRYLVDTIGIPSSKIVLAGESAGGNLVSTTLLKLKSQLNREPEPQPLLLPAGAALLSPFVDLTVYQPTFAKYQKYDILSARQVAKYVPYYIPNYNNLDEESKAAMINNPLISTVNGDFSGTCPIFLAYGEKELLRTSIENLKENLEKSGCNLTTLRGANAAHVWLVYSLIAESQQIYERDCKIFIDWMASLCNKE